MLKWAAAAAVIATCVLCASGARDARALPDIRLNGGAASCLDTYPAPRGVVASPSYKLAVAGRPVFVYAGVSFSYATLSYDFSCGPLNVVVTLVGTPGNNVTVRPLRYGIRPSVQNQTVSFVVTSPVKLSIEPGGTALLLFLDPPEEDVPAGDDPRVLFLGPGVHNLTEPCPLTPERPMLYLAGGAYVQAAGALACVSLPGDYSLLGRGILVAPPAHNNSTPVIPTNAGPSCLVQFQGGQVRVRGITVVSGLGPPMFQLCIGGGAVDRPHVLDGVKLLSTRENSDGVHAGPAYQLLNSFILAHDDAIDISQGSYHAEVRNNVVWSTWGSVLLLSWTGRFNTGHALVDGLDVIHWDTDCWRRSPSGACGDTFANEESIILFQHDCPGNLSDILIRDVRVESTGRNSRLATWRIGPNSWGCGVGDAHVGSLRDVRLEQVYLPGPSIGLHGGRNFIRGYDANRTISNVSFHCVRAGSTWVTSAVQLDLDIGPFSSNITFAADNCSTETA